MTNNTSEMARRQSLNNRMLKRIDKLELGTRIKVEYINDITLRRRSIEGFYQGTQILSSLDEEEYLRLAREKDYHTKYKNLFGSKSEDIMGFKGQRIPVTSIFKVTGLDRKFEIEGCTAMAGIDYSRLKAENLGKRVNQK
ncbi:MAG: hypothetical protein AABW51_03735 [Nanoarchaeota archaeon]